MHRSLGMQHHGIRSGVKTVRRDKLPRRVRPYSACRHRDGAFAGLPSLMVTTRRRLIPHGTSWLVLAGGNAGIALDTTFGVTKEFHPCHLRSSATRNDLARVTFRFLHPVTGS